VSESGKKAESWVDKYSRVLRKIEIGTVTLCGIVLVVLMILTGANVIGRYVFNHPIMGAIEVSILLFLMIIMLAQPWVQALRGHLGLEFILERLPRKSRPYFNVAALIAIFIICVLLTWQSARFVSRNLNGAFFGGVTVYWLPGIIFMPIAFGIVCLRIPVQIYEDIMKIRKRTSGVVSGPEEKGEIPITERI
jgi:TRAP-type C4-dicarboxylate transport system permease small subunit